MVMKDFTLQYAAHVRFSHDCCTQTFSCRPTEHEYRLRSSCYNREFSLRKYTSNHWAVIRQSSGSVKVFPLIENSPTPNTADYCDHTFNLPLQSVLSLVGLKRSFVEYTCYSLWPKHLRGISELILCFYTCEDFKSIEHYGLTQSWTCFRIFHLFLNSTMTWYAYFYIQLSSTYSLTHV